MLAAKVRGERWGPFDCALPFLYPLLHRAALIVEGDDALGRSGQAGHDEADAMPAPRKRSRRAWSPSTSRDDRVAKGWRRISGNLSPLVDPLRDGPGDARLANTAADQPARARPMVAEARLLGRLGTGHLLGRCPPPSTWIGTKRALGHLPMPTVLPSGQ